MLVLAIFLWLFVVLNQQYETAIDIPLNIVEMKTNKVLISEVPENVAVKFSGSGKDLLILKYIQQASVDLDIHTINYFYDYPIQMEFIVTPPALDVEPLYLIGPDTAMIRLEDQLVKRIPVIPNITVRSEPGYTLGGSITTIPDSVTVSGPQTVVRRLRRIETEERSYEGLQAPMEDVVSIIEVGKKVIIAPSHVRVNIPVDKISERVITQIPVTTSRIIPGRRILLEPSIVDVRVLGPASRLSDLTADSIVVNVDLDRWRSNVRDYEPHITLPDGIEFVSVNPNKVRVRVEIEY